MMQLDAHRIGKFVPARKGLPRISERLACSTINSIVRYRNHCTVRIFASTFPGALSACPSSPAYSDIVGCMLCNSLAGQEAQVLMVDSSSGIKYSCGAEVINFHSSHVGSTIDKRQGVSMSWCW